ncbi:uncharacterized protein LOC135349542 [Halichondria panicea]|uniref:uncharacterized protein LOC135349542 n=1 Tax=Halichondria panicea TaxID=6063 RepID=UPI00312BBD37
MISGRGDSLDRYLTDLICRDKKSELTKKWVNPDHEIRQKALQLFPEACENHHVFDRSTEEHPKTRVTIRSIKGTKYDSLFDENSLAVYAGGPGSMMGAALNSTLSGPQQKVMFVTYDFKYSNARSSSYFYTVSKGTSVSNDSLLRPPTILYHFLHRLMLSNKGLEAEARKLSYLKVDLSLKGIFSSASNCLNTASILSRAFYHTYRNVIIDSISPANTDWAHSRNYARCSVPIFRYLEDVGESVGLTSHTPSGKPSLLVDTETELGPSKSLHLEFDKEGAQLVQKENRDLVITNQIASKEMSPSDISAALGEPGEIDSDLTAFVYPEDGRISSDMNVTLRSIVEKTGNTWSEGVAVDSVYIDENGVRGVLFQSVNTGKKWYQPCSSVVLSLGYSAVYEFEQPRQATSARILSYPRNIISLVKWKFGLSSPVPSITTAAGCSGYFLMKGKIAIIGAHNSHWTEVAYSPQEDLTLGKLTGGGNLGSEYAAATYALNNLEHLRALFKDHFVDVLSVDSCPRSVNPKNEVQFYKLAPGLVVSAGLGGTGMTQSGANGALSYLLAHPAASSKDLIPGYQDLLQAAAASDLVHERTATTLRALNLKSSFSATELVSFGAVGLSLYYIVDCSMRVRKRSVLISKQRVSRLVLTVQRMIRRIRI